MPVEHTNSIGMKFRLIPPGEFLMGMKADELEQRRKDSFDREWHASQQPQRRVVLTRPYYLAATEVTQRQYEQLMKANPSVFRPGGAQASKVQQFDASELPVDSLTWAEMLTFCNAASRQEGLPPRYEIDGTLIRTLPTDGYALPTEAEWECAVRAGTQTRYFCGETAGDLLRFSWLSDNSGQSPHPVAQKERNPFGLFDVYGNLWENCEDRTPVLASPFPPVQVDPPAGAEGDFVIIKGGFYGNVDNIPTSGMRARPSPSERHPQGGMRLRLSVDAVRQTLKVQGPADSGNLDRIRSRCHWTFRSRTRWSTGPSWPTPG